MTKPKSGAAARFVTPSCVAWITEPCFPVDEKHEERLVDRCTTTVLLSLLGELQCEDFLLNPALCTGMELLWKFLWDKAQ